MASNKNSEELANTLRENTASGDVVSLHEIKSFDAEEFQRKILQAVAKVNELGLYAELQFAVSNNGECRICYVIGRAK